MHDVVNMELLKKYKEPLEYFPQRKLKTPPPIEIEGYMEYEVESIMKHRMRNNRHEYLVHWVGYTSFEDLWEPLKNLGHCLEMLQDFHNQQRDTAGAPPEPLKRLIKIQKDKSPPQAKNIQIKK